MQFLAILSDSIRESRDRKIFWVLLAMTGVIVLAMLSVGFHGDRVTFLFGAFDAETGHFNPLSALGRERIASIAVYLLVSNFLGWIGVILMVIATANFFPNLMERGTIDVMLAKPISRPVLFLYKYIASMTFVLLQATIFVVLTFLVMGLHWRVWLPGYLMCIPLLVLLFSYLFCVTALVGVKTGSSLAAVLYTLGAWVVFALLPAGAQGLTLLKADENSAMYRVAEIAAWIPPKTGQIPYIAARWSGAGSVLDLMPEHAMQGQDPDDRAQTDRVVREAMNRSPLVSIGSSLLFEAVVVLIAMWVFSRKDF